MRRLLKILFTDIDGTLLDRNYSFDVSLPKISELKRLKYPIIFCTTKTRAEVEHYRKIFGVNDPFIVENGSAIYIPEGYFLDFSFDLISSISSDLRLGSRIGIDKREGYVVVELAAVSEAGRGRAERSGVERYEHVRRVLKEVACEAGVDVTGFGDMSVQELAAVSGLSVELAALAKQREYSESFVLNAVNAITSSTGEGMRERMQEMMRSALKRGFRITYGGRFFTIYRKEADKGRAVRVLKSLFGCSCSGGERIQTYGIGDSANDIPMLSAVDFPALVRQHDGSSCIDHAPEDLRSRIYLTENVGPEGFVEFVRKFL